MVSIKPGFALLDRREGDAVGCDQHQVITLLRCRGRLVE